MIELENKKLIKSSSVLSQMIEMEHEQVVFCHDQETGLKAIIAIHNTILGPALGGTRMWQYDNEIDALTDVLRLSRGMTYKAAITGLSLGGGKAVIIGDSSIDKTEALMRKFGQYVNSLAGKYITAEDVGMSTQDMEQVKMETDYVTGIPLEMGGSGDPSPVTAYGVYMGMKAAAKFKWNSDNLSGKKILVQGIGHVGENLVKHLVAESARVIINDINQDRVLEVSKKYGTEIILGDDIYDQDIDIYSPCALGSTINDYTLNKLKCSIIAGAANNQLEDEDKHGRLVKEKGLIYAPDFLINAGGLINVYSELKGYDRDKALDRTRNIYDTTLEILLKAKNDSITTHEAALELAKQRIASKINI